MVVGEQALRDVKVLLEIGEHKRSCKKMVLGDGGRSYQFCREQNGRRKSERRSTR